MKKLFEEYSSKIIISILTAALIGGSIWIYNFGSFLTSLPAKEKRWEFLLRQDSMKIANLEAEVFVYQHDSIVAHSKKITQHEKDILYFYSR
jgi:hypothetical protein